MVHSASITSWPTEYEHVYLGRQLLFLTVGCLLAWRIAITPIERWERAAPYLFWASVLLLVAVLVPGVGVRIKGAQRWFHLGPFSLQPSELLKLTLPMYLSYLLVRRRDRLNRFIAGTVPLVLPIALVVALVVVQPDLGTSLFLAFSGGLALLIGGWPIRHFVLYGLLCAPAACSVLVLKPYQIKRITGFLQAWTDFDQAPYQLKQSLVTLGAGGLFGVGLGRGWQKMSFLPEANTDFVFAVIGEELGLIGTCSLIALWVALYLAGLKILRPLPPTSFAWIVGLTLLTQLIFQAALNVAVVTAMVPPKGISHPLISYGGSNLVVSLSMLGLILSAARSADRDSICHSEER